MSSIPKLNLKLKINIDHLKITPVPKKSQWFLDHPIEHYSWNSEGIYVNPQGQTFYLPHHKQFGKFINQYFKQYMSTNTPTVSCQPQQQLEMSARFNHQDFITDYMAPDKPYRGLLVNHDLGSGKTRTAIETAELYRKIGVKPIIMCPGALRPNWLEEIKTWGGPDLRRPSNYSELSSHEKIIVDAKLDDKIQTEYDIITSNASRSFQLLDRLAPEGLKHRFIILEEVHNILSRIVNSKNIKSQGYKIYQKLLNGVDCKILALSATPLLNKSFELGILFNVLKGPMTYKGVQYTLFPETQEEFDNTFINYNNLKLQNEDVFTKRILGLVSYYSGAKANVYPELIVQSGGPFQIQFSDHQFSSYYDLRNYEIEKEIAKNKQKAMTFTQNHLIDLLKKEVSSMFRIYSRETCNFSFPDELPRPYRYDYKYSYPLLLHNNWNEWTVPQLLRFTQMLFTYQEVNNFISEMDLSDLPETSDFTKLPITTQRQIYLSILTKHQGFLDFINKWSQAVINIHRIRLFRQFIATHAVNINPKDETQIKDNILHKDNTNTNTNTKTSGTESDPEDDHESDIEDDDTEDTTSARDIDKEYRRDLQNTINNLRTHPDKFLTDQLDKLSPKMSLVYKNIMEGEGSQGSNLIYSQFLTGEGIFLFSEVLQAHGFKPLIIKNYTDAELLALSTENVNRFVIYSGEQDQEIKKLTLKLFNHPLNINGNICKSFLGTAAAAEGLSLKNVRQVHILEPYWNRVRINQVIGRARRICSHQSLPPDQRQVYVYEYLMVMSKQQQELMRETDSTDQYIYKIGKFKEEINQQFLQVMKNSAVDCFLNLNYNYSDTNPIKCFSFNDDETGIAFYPQITGIGYGSSSTSSSSSSSSSTDITNLHTENGVLQHVLDKPVEVTHKISIPIDIFDWCSRSHPVYTSHGQYKYVYKYIDKRTTPQYETILVTKLNKELPAIILYDRLLAETNNTLIPVYALIVVKGKASALPTTHFTVLNKPVMTPPVLPQNFSYC